MNLFRALLVAIFTVIIVYTIIVIANHGISPLFTVFFGDMAAMGWPGQFNLDFMVFLILSGLWMAWRNNFSPAGLALGALAPFGGAPLLTTYLFFVSFSAQGDMKEILLGKTRANA